MPDRDLRRILLRRDDRREIPSTERGVNVLQEYPSQVLIEVPESTLDGWRDEGWAITDLTNQNKIWIGNEGLDPFDVEISSPPERDRDGRHFYVQFIGPIKNEWTTALRQSGVSPLAFYHDFSYLVSGRVERVVQVTQEAPWLESTAVSYEALRPELKLSPRVRALLAERRDTPRRMRVLVLVFRDLERFRPRQFFAEFDLRAREQKTHTFYRRFVLSARESAVRALAKRPEVYAIQHRPNLQWLGEKANQIAAGNVDPLAPGYVAWLSTHGVDGTGVTIAVKDNGILADHPAFLDAAGNTRVTKVNPKDAYHGTMVAGQAAGDYRDESSDGYILGLGVAPGARLLDVSSVAEVTTHGPAEVFNNSWGWPDSEAVNYGMNYEDLDSEWDRHVRTITGTEGGPPLVVCFAAGNESGSGLKRPAGAKNVITVGCGENEWTSLNRIEADDRDHRWVGSSVGNCADERGKPDVLVPGHYSAAARHPDFPDVERTISDRLLYGTQTSAACGLASGACALIIQWWRQRYGGGETPSPAMVKALLVNGATDLYSASENRNVDQHVPSRQQGWGRIHLENIFEAAASSIHHDQQVLLTLDGPPFELDIQVVDELRPLQVTLVWTDVPGNIHGGTSPQNSALVNRLLLEVSQPGATWSGNVFDEGWSQSGGAPDPILDNVQNVFLKEPTGNFRGAVTPVAINANCLDPADPTAGSLKQDFALVVRNARAAPPP